MSSRSLRATWRNPTLQGRSLQPSLLPYLRERTIVRVAEDNDTKWSRCAARVRERMRERRGRGEHAKATRARGGALGILGISFLVSVFFCCVFWVSSLLSLFRKC